MELSIQEVHSYNELVDKGKFGKINCPFNETDLVISKLDNDDKVYFYCMSCKTSFYPGVNTVKIIKDALLLKK